MSGTPRIGSGALSAAFTRVSRRADSLAPVAPGPYLREPLEPVSTGFPARRQSAGCGLKPDTRRPLKRPPEAVVASQPGARGARLSALRETRVNAAEAALD